MTAPACWAPRTALYFEPTGTVRACCASALILGRVGVGPGRRPLAEIWEGALRAAQAEALASGDFSLGCAECGVPAASGARDASLAATFDRYAGDAPLDRPVVMDFALSNRCNLQCVMCNGELSSSIRQLREHRPPLPTVYDDRFFDELVPFLPSLRVAMFKGGEPFLSPEASRVWDLLLELAPDCHVSVTTNGTVWTERVEHLVRELRMEVAVSVDGVTPETLEAIRVGADGAALWRNIDRFTALADEVGRPLRLNFCLLRHNWQELLPFLRECDRRGAHAEVIVVNQPRKDSLLGLPREQLDAVVAALEALEPAAQQLDRARRAWDHALSLLRPIDAAPVEIGAGPSSRVTGTRSLPDVLDDLRAVSSEAPLLLETAMADVTRVLAEPAWAEPLDPQRWVGRRTFELEDLLAESFGTALAVEVVQGPDGSVRATVSLPPGAPLPFARLHVASYPPPQGRMAPQLIAMVPDDRGDAAGRS